MKYYGIDNEGPFNAEKVSILPAWTSSDEGRMVYSESDAKYYYGSSSNWVETGGVDELTFTSHTNASDAHNATSAATAERIILRDANGRAQVADPSAGADIATKSYVDSVSGGGGGDSTGYAIFCTDPEGTARVDNATVLTSTFMTSTVTWYTVGPTGAGTDTTWAALDNIPDDVDWIEVWIDSSVSITSGSATTNYFASLSALSFSGTETTVSHCDIRYHGGYANSSGRLLNRMTGLIKLHVSDTKKFQLYKDQLGSGETFSFSMYLTGYGKN